MHPEPPQFPEDDWHPIPTILGWSTQEFEQVRIAEQFDQVPPLFGFAEPIGRHRREVDRWRAARILGVSVLSAASIAAVSVPLAQNKGMFGASPAVAAELIPTADMMISKEPVKAEPAASVALPTLAVKLAKPKPVAVKAKPPAAAVKVKRAVLDFVALKTVAEQAGFPRDVSPTMAAIALGESGGKTDAVNATNRDGSTDFGLWQINTVHKDLLAGKDWRDPATNAAMALVVYRSQGFGAWSAYTQGKHRKYLRTELPTPKVRKLAYSVSNAPAAKASRGDRIVAAAHSYKDVPYRYGGTTRSGLDCSGLVQNVMRDVGIKAPRTSSAQRAWVKPISKSEARPGDLVFGPGHVGIFIGGGKMIDAANDGVPVQVHKIYSDMHTYGRVPAN